MRVALPSRPRARRNICGLSSSSAASCSASCRRSAIHCSRVPTWVLSSVRRPVARTKAIFSLLAPEEVAQIFLSGEFVINSDRNRYIEYATPRFNYDRTEWEKVNLVRMAALAKFPRLAVEPGGSGPLWELVQRFNEGDDLRPQRARAALGLSRPPPPGAR